MQKSLSKDQLRKQINEDTKRLRENIELLKKQEGIETSAKQKELRRQYNEAKRKEQLKAARTIPEFKSNRFDEIVYRFKCPDCNSSHTKRTGLTTQREPKARFLCLNCQEKWRANQNVDRMFFTLSNNDIESIIKNDDSLTKEKREFFLDRYLIKK